MDDGWRCFRRRCILCLDTEIWEQADYRGVLMLLQEVGSPEKRRRLFKLRAVVRSWMWWERTWHAGKIVWGNPREKSRLGYTESEAIPTPGEILRKKKEQKKWLLSRDREADLLPRGREWRWRVGEGPAHPKNEALTCTEPAPPKKSSQCAANQK